MKKILKGIFALTMCVIIVGSSVSVSAASRSNTYMVTNCTSKNASMTVRNDFTVDSMYAQMEYLYRSLLDGNLYSDWIDKTTNRTRSCNLSLSMGTFNNFSSVYFEGRIEGSIVGDWKLSAS